MFRDMRRSNQQLPRKEALDILSRATSGVLSIPGDEGYPYGVPLSPVLFEGALYFHSAKKGHKADAVKNGCKASFTVIEQDHVVPAEYTTRYRSVIAFGKLHIVDDEAEALSAIRALGNKFNPEQDEALEREINGSANCFLVLKLEIEHLTGKESKALAKQRRNA